MSKQASVSNSRFMYTASYTFPHFAPGASEQSTAKGISVFKLETDGSFEIIQTIETHIDETHINFHPFREFIG